MDIAGQRFLLGVSNLLGRNTPQAHRNPKGPRANSVHVNAWMLAAKRPTLFEVPLASLFRCPRSKLRSKAKSSNQYSVVYVTSLIRSGQARGRDHHMLAVNSCSNGCLVCQDM
eukprot:6111041-Amphidinium_carterae.1